MILYGIEHLIESEEKTSAVTSNCLKGFAEHYLIILDVMLKFPYFSKLEEITTLTGEFQSIAMISYIQAPYSFRSMYGLYEKGYYIESLLIYRHLIEAFIQLKYFHKYPQKLMEHIKQTKRVNFSVMFNEFSPGYYKRFYCGQLSEAAHGLVYKDIHRVERFSKDTARTIMGCEFSEVRASHVMNQIVALMFGYINNFRNFFPNNNLDEDKKILRKFNYVIEWLELSMEGHKKVNPSSLDWYRHMENFIR